MKAHLFAISLWGITAGAARHHDIAALEARQAIPANAAVSVCYTYTSTYLTLVTPTTIPGPSVTVTVPGPSVTVLPSGVSSASALPSGVSSASAQPSPSAAFFSVILGIEPVGVAKRDLQKRAGLGGFVTNNPAAPNAVNCSGATIFQLQVGGGLFLDQGLPLFTTAGTSFGEFRSLGAPPANAITTQFSGADGTVLTWTNSAFLGGAVSFCQVPATGQVYSTFQGQNSVPAGCVTILLRIYLATRCINGNIDGIPTSSAAPIPTTQSVGPTPTNTFSSFTRFGNSSTSTIPDNTNTVSSQETPTSIAPLPPPSSEASPTVTPSSAVPSQPASSSAFPSETASSSSEVGPPSSSAFPSETASSSSEVAPSSSSEVASPSTSSVGSSSFTDVFPSSTSSIESSSSPSPTDVFPSSTSSSAVTDTGASSSSLTSSASLSSASQITITSTSTETTFVVASSSSSAAAASSSGACPFTTSGSLIVNGGFENAAANPFAFAPLGSLPGTAKAKKRENALRKKQNLEEVHENNIVPASTAPRTYSNLCNNILEISYLGGTQETVDVFGTILPFTAPLQTYTISFDILACGTDGTVTVSINDFSQTFDNQDCTDGTTAAWTTISGTFVAFGTVADTVYIRATGEIAASQDYFDNFVVVPFFGGTGASSSSSAAALPTQPALRKVRL
ncbi:hypothetical protein N0V93_006624 [Gnomoniopsis smithogilvyi]|uniref:DUF7908 domain-containing protein n=1 Tax=Gnomoniopsis smithogilvyi TaxID=1191159 RepID=A0A9W8YQ08_9PEZI|nr:hypothetical protein N0V93_006624 [Gnomoniopsis smithogilvyi]